MGDYLTSGRCSFSLNWLLDYFYSSPKSLFHSGRGGAFLTGGLLDFGAFARVFGFWPTIAESLTLLAVLGLWLLTGVLVGVSLYLLAGLCLSLLISTKKSFFLAC